MWATSPVGQRSPTRSWRRAPAARRSPRQSLGFGRSGLERAYASSSSVNVTNTHYRRRALPLVVFGSLGTATLRLRRGSPGQDRRLRQRVRRPSMGGVVDSLRGRCSATRRPGRPAWKPSRRIGQRHADALRAPAARTPVSRPAFRCCATAVPSSAHRPGVGGAAFVAPQHTSYSSKLAGGLGVVGVWCSARPGQRGAGRPRSSPPAGHQSSSFSELEQYGGDDQGPVRAEPKRCSKRPSAFRAIVRGELRACLATFPHRPGNDEEAPRAATWNRGWRPV